MARGLWLAARGSDAVQDLRLAAQMRFKARGSRLAGSRLGARGSWLVACPARGSRLIYRVRARSVLRACVLRACSVLRMRPCSVRACSVLRSWELMGTCGNLWELMGTCGNLWELRVHSLFRMCRVYSMKRTPVTIYTIVFNTNIYNNVHEKYLIYSCFFIMFIKFFKSLIYNIYNVYKQSKLTNYNNLHISYLHCPNSYITVQTVIFSELNNVHMRVYWESSLANTSCRHKDSDQF